MESKTLNISVNLQDIEIDCEDHNGLSFSDALRKALIYDAQAQVRKMVSDKLDALVLKEIGDNLDILIPAMIQARLESIHTTEKFKSQYGTETTLSDLIMQKIAHTSFDRSLNGFVDDVAKKYSEQTKKQYDSRFAAGVVEGLNKHGLLNADAAKILLSN